MTPPSTAPMPSSSTPTTPATAAPAMAVATPSLLAATRATPEIKTQDLQQAVDLYQKGTELAHHAATSDDVVRAIELFSIAIAVRADQPRFFFARGNAFRAVNELERAAQDYGRAIALDDRTAAYFANRGACFRKLHQPAKALEDLTAAIDMDSKKAGHYLARALVLCDHGFFKEATIDLTRALEDGAAGIRVEYKALQLRGTCFRKLGHLQKCIDDLQRAIQLDGRNSTGFSSLAQAFLDAGELDHAIEHFSNAIQFNTAQASYYALRGLCYYRQCHTTSGTGSTISTGPHARLCLADFNQAIKLDGKDPQAYFYRGSIRLALALEAMEPSAAAPTSTASTTTGPTSGTRPALPSAVSTAPHDASIAASLSADEQLEAAFADLEMAWTLKPKGVKFQIGVAMITQLKQQYETASALFTELLQPSSSSSERVSLVVKYHGALCAHMLGDVETALTLLCDCVDEAPTEPLFFEARALVLHEAAYFELAIDDFSDAVALRSDRDRDRVAATSSAIAWQLYLRAECHLRLGHFEDTVRDATSVLQVLEVPATAVVPALEMSARNARAMAYRGLGEYDQAIDDLTTCLRLSPQHDIFSYHRALCFLECERFADALPDLHAAAATATSTSDDASLLYCIGLCYYHEQQPRACIDYMERAKLALDRSGTAADTETARDRTILPDLHYRMGVAHALEGRFICAIEHFTDAVDASPLDAVVQRVTYVHERAKALQMERYYDESIDDFSFVLTHNANNAHAYFRRGFAFKALGRLREAAADFESAKLLDPTNPRLVVKYKELKDTDCIVLCAPGDEPAF